MSSLEYVKAGFFGACGGCLTVVGIMLIFMKVNKIEEPQNNSQKTIREKPIVGKILGGVFLVVGLICLSAAF